MRIAPIDRPALVRALGWTTAWGLAIAATVHPLATWAARVDWRADLICHFREPAMALSLLAAASMARGRRLVAVGLALLAAWQGWELARCSWPNPVSPDPASSARLRVLVANVLVDNPDREALIRLIRRERPDVVGLIEVSRDWLAGLEPVRSEYPHRFEHPDDEEGRGLALWFRAPPVGVKPASPLLPGGNPAIHAVIDFDGRPRQFWLIHNVSPFERPAILPIGGELDALAGRVKRDEGSTLVVGDLNCTDGSPHFGRFLRASGLLDSRLGFGRQPSWPAWSWYRIAIDHAFLTPDLAVVDRRLGPAIGSDHFPVILEVAPAARSRTKEAAQASHSPASPASPGSSSANLARSATRRNATSRPARSGPSRSISCESSPTSSVVFEAQAGP